ncbi:MAG: manganese efflux pump [Chloroflexi bacterium]|nr:manganese efflux pump [Chloroflexota bacterium]
MTGADFISVFLIALGLSADCFAVAVSGIVSMKKLSRFQALRVASSFGLFQGMMPVFGWLAGRAILQQIAIFDHWVAFGLLVFVGGRMLWQSFQSKEKSGHTVDISRGLMLLLLSVATSIDALAVGLSFAFLDLNIVLSSLVIGVVALGVTISGFVVGRKAGDLIGKRAEFFGGLILVGIGFRILLSHLLA